MVINTIVALTFSDEMNAASITINTSDSTCSGSLQVTVATDNFSTCVQMSGSPTMDTANKEFRFHPASHLAENTAYLVKVTANATNSSGKALSEPYVTNSGFTTGSSLGTGELTTEGDKITIFNIVSGTTVDYPCNLRFGLRTGCREPVPDY